MSRDEFPGRSSSLACVFSQIVGDSFPASPPEKKSKRSESAPHPTMPCGFLSRDFQGAHKQMSAKDRSLNICAAWDPKGERYRYYQCSYMRFGSLWAVSSWVRISRAVQFILEKELMLLDRIYIDDIIATERMSLIKKAGEHIDEIMFRLGFKMSPEKAECGRSLRILGLEYQIDDNGVSTDLRLVKRQKMAKEAAFIQSEILNSKPVSSKQIQSLAGKCNFLLIATRCSGVAAAVSPLYELCANLNDSDPINPGKAMDALPAIEHLKKLIMVVPPLVVKADAWADEVVHVWTDASQSERENKAAFFAVINGKIFVAEMEFPSKFIRILKERKKKLIGELEIAAMTIAADTLLREIKASCKSGRPKVVFHTDNTTCLFGCLKGTSRDIIIRILIQSFRLSLAASGISFTLRYVPTKSNPADGGTREDLFAPFCRMIKSLKMPALLIESLQMDGLEKAFATIDSNTKPKQAS